MGDINVKLSVPAGITTKVTVGSPGLPKPGEENSFIISGPSPFQWLVKTLNQIKGILGLDYSFQTPVFTNPLILDATLHKDFKAGLITGNTTVNLTNSSNGDAGMIELLIDGTGGYDIELGSMFTKCIGGELSNEANADNFISWRNVAGDIVYTITQVQS